MMGHSTFPQSSSITGASPSDCLMLNPWHSLVYVCVWGGLTFLQRWSRYIFQPQATGLMGGEDYSGIRNPKLRQSFPESQTCSHSFLELRKEKRKDLIAPYFPVFVLLFYQGFWVPIQRKEGASTARLRPTQRNHHSHNDPYWQCDMMMMRLIVINLPRYTVYSKHT